MDYPVPATVSQAYGPHRGGFDTPIEPREDLKGPAPIVDDRRTAIRAANPANIKSLLPRYRAYAELSEDVFRISEPKALTTGGYLSYQSGYLADFLQLNAMPYTTQPLYANQEARSTWNLTPDGDQITVFGQANGRLKFAGQELTIGWCARRSSIRTTPA
jgi:hypothetical protein